MKEFDWKQEIMRGLFIAVFVGLVMTAMRFANLRAEKEFAKQAVEAEFAKVSEAVNAELELAKKIELDGIIINAADRSMIVQGDYKPYDIPMDEELQEFTYWCCKAYDVDFKLVLAVMWNESRFAQVGNAMQIMPINAKWLQKYGTTNLDDPKQSIQAGVVMLEMLYDRYGDATKAMMAFNMGEGGAKKLWEQGITSTKYTDRAWAKYKELEAQDD